MTIADALKNAQTELKDIVKNPHLDAEVVLSSLLNKERAFLITHTEQELKKSAEKKFIKLIKRRKKQEPLAYLIGSQPFYSNSFLVNKHTLIPRPETEQIIELIKKDFADKKEVTIIDVGTGSGNIALTLAKEIPTSTVFGLDLKKTTLKIAEQNRHLLKAKNVTFLKSDLLKRFLRSNLTVDVIVANLPYLTEEDLKNSPTVAELEYEPIEALVANDFGLSLIKKCIRQSLLLIKKGGKLYFEFHPTQTETILNWLKSEKLPFKSTIVKDFAKHDRFLILEFVF